LGFQKVYLGLHLGYFKAKVFDPYKALGPSGALSSLGASSRQGLEVLAKYDPQGVVKETVAATSKSGNQFESVLEDQCLDPDLKSLLK
jgi:hypothetical protein